MSPFAQETLNKFGLDEQFVAAVMSSRVSGKWSATLLAPKVESCLEYAFCRFEGSVDNLRRESREWFRETCVEVGLRLGQAQTPAQFVEALATHIDGVEGYRTKRPSAA